MEAQPLGFCLGNAAVAICGNCCFFHRFLLQSRRKFAGKHYKNITAQADNQEKRGRFKRILQAGGFSANGRAERLSMPQKLRATLDRTGVFRLLSVRLA